MKTIEQLFKNKSVLVKEDVFDIDDIDMLDTTTKLRVGLFQTYNKRNDWAYAKGVWIKKGEVVVDEPEFKDNILDLDANIVSKIQKKFGNGIKKLSANHTLKIHSNSKPFEFYAPNNEMFGEPQARFVNTKFVCYSLKLYPGDKLKNCEVKCDDLLLVDAVPYQKNGEIMNKESLLGSIKNCDIECKKVIIYLSDSFNDFFKDNKIPAFMKEGLKDIKFNMIEFSLRTGRKKKVYAYTHKEFDNLKKN